MTLPHLTVTRKARPTSVTTCPCSGRSRLEVWGEPSGSFEAGCCGYRTVFVKPRVACPPSPVTGHPQTVRCGCAYSRVTIERGPVLGLLRCGHCKESTEFVAQIIRPPRQALVDAPEGGTA